MIAARIISDELANAGMYVHRTKCDECDIQHDVLEEACSKCGKSLGFVKDEVYEIA